jgi:hypothetical protein
VCYRDRKLCLLCVFRAPLIGVRLGDFQHAALGEGRAPGMHV